MKNETKKVPVKEIQTHIEKVLEQLKKTRRKEMTAAQFFQFFMDITTL